MRIRKLLYISLFIVIFSLILSMEGAHLISRNEAKQITPPLHTFSAAETTEVEASSVVTVRGDPKPVHRRSSSPTERHHSSLHGPSESDPQSEPILLFFLGLGLVLLSNAGRRLSNK